MRREKKPSPEVPGSAFDIKLDQIDSLVFKTLERLRASDSTSPR